MLKAGDKVLTYLGFLSDRPRVEAQVTLSRRNTEEPAAAWAVAHGMEHWWVRFEGDKDEFARYINERGE